MPQPGHLAAHGSGTYTPSPLITLEVTPEMLATLEQVSRDAGQPLDVVFTRAIGLYQAALRASAEGKHVGYVTSPDALEVEFTGLASPTVGSSWPSGR